MTFSSLRSLALVVVCAGIGLGVAGSSREANAASAGASSGASAGAGLGGPAVSSLSSAPVTVYGAKWCSACRSLERGLTDRKIAFEVVDVDANPSAFARAREAANATSAIPLTGIVRTSNTVWVVGADVDAVDRAQRGE